MSRLRRTCRHAVVSAVAVFALIGAVMIPVVGADGDRHHEIFPRDSSPYGNTFLFGVPVPGGMYTPSVSDGYWLLLPPLSRGKHTLAVQTKGGFISEVTYHLTIGK